VEFRFDGTAYQALQGESLAAALWAVGVTALRRSDVDGAPRGIYCGIGHCFECRVHVLGMGTVRACLTPVTAGMQVFSARPEAAGAE